MAAAQARQDQLTKPRGALGRLETLSVHLAGITGQPLPRLAHPVVLLMAADHGVVAEGVSAYPQSVTGQMVLNFLAGGAAINALARQSGARVVVADLGVAAALSPHPGLSDCKVAAGTANLARGPAMTRDQAVRALEIGAGLVARERAAGLDILGTGEMDIGNATAARDAGGAAMTRDQAVRALEIGAGLVARGRAAGVDILGTGEMGIGNTTAAASVAAALMGRDPSSLVGRGTGVDDAGLARKMEVVRRGL